MEEDFGDFEEVSDQPVQGKQTPVPEESTGRVKLPRGKEVIGVIMQRLGGNRMEVQCSDGKTRNCRVPGRFKRSMWLRMKDTVLIEPWQHDDSKGDVIFKYNSSSIAQLRKRGLLNSFNSAF